MKPPPTPCLRARSFAAIVTDGDGTLMTHKKLAKRTAIALQRWCASGRKLILATGESIEQLAKFPDLLQFDLVVAENGALLFWPRTKKQKILTKARPHALVRALRHHQIPLTVGDVIVSTESPYDRILQQTIEELKLDWQVIRNRKEFMALPKGVDKSTGVCAALKELGLQSKTVIGIGDAENDVALLQCCGVGAAVRGAVPRLRKCADLTTDGGSGIGVVRLINCILQSQDSLKSKGSEDQR